MAGRFRTILQIVSKGNIHRVVPHDTQPRVGYFLSDKISLSLFVPLGCRRIGQFGRQLTPDMSPPVSEWPWTDYIFRPFPVLFSSKHPLPQVGHIEFTHRLYPNTSDRRATWRQLLWAAIVKLTSLYIDAPEFVFAEIRENQPISAFRVNTAVIQQDSTTWADLASTLADLERCCIPASSARTALKLADSVNPYPVVVVWDSFAPELEDVDGSAVVIEVGTQNERNGNIAIVVRWNHSILSPKAAQIFMKQTLALLKVAAADPSRTASTLDLDPTLSSVIEANFNPEEAYCATDWLVRNAVERPDAVAHEIYANLSSPPRLLTYAELNTMANKLARWLRSRGLKLEDRVALCRSKDLHFYVAHAAIFKSGGCYVAVRRFIGSPRCFIHTHHSDRSRTSRRAKTSHCRRLRRKVHSHGRCVVQELWRSGLLSRFAGDPGRNRLTGSFGNIAGRVRLIGVPHLHVWSVTPSLFLGIISDGSHRDNRKTERVFAQPPWHLLGDQSYMRVPTGGFQPGHG